MHAEVLCGRPRCLEWDVEALVEWDVERLVEDYVEWYGMARLSTRRCNDRLLNMLRVVVLVL